MSCSGLTFLAGTAAFCLQSRKSKHTHLQYARHLPTSRLCKMGARARETNLEWALEFRSVQRCTSEAEFPSKRELPCDCAVLVLVIWPPPHALGLLHRRIRTTCWLGRGFWGHKGCAVHVR